MKPPKVLVIVGPTASGKSDLAVELALKFNGEVISADSRQVYKGMDIGTGKITTEEMKGVTHHMLDIALPSEVYTVERYQKDTQRKIEEIVARGKLPIICGGTGFYIDSVLYNTTLPPVGPNQKLRDELDKRIIEDLFRELEEKDFERAGSIDKHNKVKIIRALEIIETLGKVPKAIKTSPYNALVIGIKVENDVLKERIHNRLVKRMENGMVEEMKSLHTAGLTWERMFALGLEYRYLSLYLKGDLKLEEMLAKLEMEIWHYAKRQMTWFKMRKDTKWLALSEKKEIFDAVEEFVKS